MVEGINRMFFTGEECDTAEPGRTDAGITILNRGHKPQTYEVNKMIALYRNNECVGLVTVDEYLNLPNDFDIDGEYVVVSTL
jgi:hypothetical protein